MGVRIQHVASCPEDDPVLCATDPFDPYRHDQRITWGRLEGTVSVGLGKGVVVGATLPVDVRAVRVDYATLDGEPMQPPSEIHHRDETLAGPVDGRVLLQAYRMDAGWTLGAGLGSTAPIGKTVPDPFRLTEQGLEHEHLQFGSGTFDPVASLTAMRQWERWGVIGALGGRFPLYEGGNGYRGAVVVDASIGPSFRATQKIQAWTLASPLFETPERWHGDPHGGRVAIVTSAGASWAVRPQTVLQAELRATAYQWSFEGRHDTLVQRWVLTLGMSHRTKADDTASERAKQTTSRSGTR